MSETERISDSYQRLVGEVYPRLVDAVRRRYQASAGKFLRDVYHMDADFLSLEPGAVQFVLDNQTEITQILEDPALLDSLLRLFILSALEFTYASNQFIQMDALERSEFEGIYRSYLQRMKSILIEGGTFEQVQARLERLIFDHFQELRQNIQRTLRKPGAGLEDTTLLNSVVCREYSPAFQLEILGIRVEDLLEPVLDLGCGKAGHLVQHLNERGIRAYGIDRLVDQSDRLMEGDWLETPLEPGAWGTVISHLAFSNHFIFHHLYKNGNPAPYARQYMAVLEALKPGGAFYYAPGLPFIEPLLPAERFSVIRRPVSGLGNGVYCTQVIRKDNPQR